MYTNLMIGMLFVIGVIVTLVSIPMVKHMLVESNLVRLNYRGDSIPVGMGVVFIPTLLINSIILIFVNSDYERIMNIFVLLFAVIVMSFAGIIDDSIGNRNVTGLKGHFKSLFKGKLTTGAFKALLGGFVGLTIAVTYSKSPVEIIISSLLVALSTNFMNLLDLRPGRAIKVYLFLSVIIFASVPSFNREIMVLLLPAVMAYFYTDLKAYSMMGDAGSNVLGVSLGVFVVSAFGFYVQLVYCILLILIHIITEKYSLTRIIENNKFLNYIDRLGRN